VLRLANIVKTFGATRAVDDVSLDVRAGEILAVVGENGAGKTTLMRIGAGELAADAGSIEREGHVELVHQHFLLVNELTIAENLALTASGFRFATKRALEREAIATIERTGIELPDVTRRVGELSVGEKAKLELIKAISRSPSVLILDEPTAVLTPYESEELFRVMRMLAASGTAVVFISHKLPEVFAIATRIVLMRSGTVITDTLTSNTTPTQLAALMLRNAGVPPAGPAASRRRSGTITAIVGVAGNGQSPLARTLLAHHPDAAHIPEDRTRDGIVAEMTIAENLSLKSRRWSPRTAAERATQLITQYSIRARSPHQRAGDLSGGNQQKVILARELDRRPSRIVAAEPTRGLDLESTRFVHDQLRAAAEAGAEITLITSDLDEAFALADTIRVIYRGHLSEPMAREEATHRVANLMAGLE
jgi:simple sugar transport system ATP-binding protein